VAFLRFLIYLFCLGAFICLIPRSQAAIHLMLNGTTAGFAEGWLELCVVGVPAAICFALASRMATLGLNVERLPGFKRKDKRSKSDDTLTAAEVAKKGES
jgi:hypothetical protein